MPAWTTPAAVIAALGPSAAPDETDPWLVQCVAAANAAAFRKRLEAGYTDDATDNAAAPSADVALGTTYWARDLWRERQSTDSFAGYEDLAAFQPTGSWGQIKRMLGIGRAQTDRPADLSAEQLERIRRRRRRWR